MVIVLIYFLALALLIFFQKKEIVQGIFKTSRKTNWIVSGISLFMLQVSMEQGQVYNGILEEKGLWGLWLFFPGMISAAIVPLVLAPLWSKLEFITDNQFILFRFSGKGARFLHQFRSIYVGGLVVSFLLGFQVLAFSRILEIYYGISSQTAIYITAILLILFALKNSLQLKLKLDVFHSIIYGISLVLIFYYLYTASGGWENTVLKFTSENSDKSNLFPPSGLKQEWNLLFVFLGIQWWSAQLFDGGGPEMSRFTATKGKWNVIKASVTPIVMSLFLSVLVIMLSVMTITLQNTPGSEAGFIKGIFNVVPEWIAPFCILGFFAIFITTAESFLNWGASFLVVDLYKTYLQKNSPESHYTRISFGSMAMLSIIALIIALNVSNLQNLIKVIFSISAGVAPIYILRWFWLRINAWSQLSAMLTSGICTLIFHVYLSFYPDSFHLSPMDAYSWQLIFVTTTTTFVWITVLFLTAPDDSSTLTKFRAILPPKKQLIKSFTLALLIGISLLCLNLLLLKWVFSSN
jgi:Na+/proline symporter